MRTIPEIDIPRSPTTEELHREHPWAVQQIAKVAMQRQKIDTALRDPAGLFINLGGCHRADYSQQPQIEAEGAMLMTLEEMLSGAVVSHRGPAHKSRTYPQRDWQGPEQTDPEGAYKSTYQEASIHGHVSTEIRCVEHLKRYGHMMAWIWTGGRNSKDNVLFDKIVDYDPSLGVGVKNGLDGLIEPAIEKAEYINRSRAHIPNAAVAIPVYRGGKNAQTKQAWKDYYRYVHELTDGMFVVDLAHGGEMAHDPKGKYQKSEAGQLAAFESVLELTEEGYAPSGIFGEATNILPSRTDPTIPLELAIEWAIKIFNEKALNMVALAA